MCHSGQTLVTAVRHKISISTDHINQLGSYCIMQNLAIICNAHLETELQIKQFCIKISTNFISLKVILAFSSCYETPNKTILMVITTVLWFVSIFLSVSVILLSHYQPVPGAHHWSRHITTATQTFLTQFLNCRPAALLYFSQSDEI